MPLDSSSALLWMLSYTPPHQRGFGTQSRFMRAEVSRATALPPSMQGRI